MKFTRLPNLNQCRRCSVILLVAEISTAGICMYCRREIRSAIVGAVVSALAVGGLLWLCLGPM
jgi:hypothetical protein